MTTTRRIPVAGPSITEREVSYVAEAAKTAWYEGANAFHDRFERAFAAYHGVKHALALPSCTSAIHLSLLALGVGAGDEVIVPDLTWIASAAPIEYVGARPVFADVDRETWCLSPATIEACLTPRTKAVIGVELYGNMPRADQIRAFCDARKLGFVEDAAEALGSKLDGKLAGTFGHTGVFSFHGSKTVTTGEGGMLVTDRDDLRARITFLRDHGRAPGERMFWNSEVAYKYKMSSLQAALGLAQIERAEELVGKKREIFGWYRDRLARHAPKLTLNAEPPGVRNSYWMVTVVLDPTLGVDKETLIARLSERGIDSRPFFYPLSSLPAYASRPEAEAARRRNQVAYAIGPYGLNLPSALCLEERDVDTVCAALVDVLKP